MICVALTDCIILSPADCSLAGEEEREAGARP